MIMKKNLTEKTRMNTFYEMSLSKRKRDPNSSIQFQIK